MYGIMKKFLLLLGTLLCAFNLSAQNYDFYLQKAYEALAVNKIDVAKASYNVYKKVTGKSDTDFERCLLNLSEISFFSELSVVANINREIDCDGIYHGPEWEYDYTKEYLYVEQNQFNRNHFGISVDFYPRNSNESKCLLSLSSGYRILNIEIRNGIIYLETNNGRHIYNTEISYLPYQWNKLELKHENGVISLRINNNNKTIDNVLMNMSDGDNDISSIDFSSGNVFNGKIKNLKIYN